MKALVSGFTDHPKLYNRGAFLPPPHAPHPLNDIYSPKTQAPRKQFSRVRPQSLGCLAPRSPRRTAGRGAQRLRGLRPEYRATYVRDLQVRQRTPTPMHSTTDRASLYASQLPLTFVLACASPPAPSYMHSTFPRSVLALLRLRSIDFPSGPSVVGKIVDGVHFLHRPPLQVRSPIIRPSSIPTWTPSYLVRPHLISLPTTPRDMLQA